MATYITIGNLTKDAEQHATEDGRNYVVLRIAENDYERDRKGQIIKDENGRYKTKQTRYHSVFVSEKAGALSASKLGKGDPVKVIGKPKFNIVKDSDNFDQNIFTSISAYKIDTEIFKNKSEEEVIASEEEVEDTPLSA